MRSAEEQRRQDMELLQIRREPELALRHQLGAYRQALWARRPAAPQFAIFAQGRSGSRLLGDLLGAHPRVVFEGEILSNPVRLPHTFVKGLRARHRELVYGFHVKPDHLSLQQRVRDQRRWLNHLVDRGWTIIHLERRNVLRQALSSAVGSVSGRYHRRDDENSRRFEVAIEPLLAGMRLRAASLAEDRRTIAGLPHESVDYERDLLDASRHQATADRLFAKLGLDSARISTELQRTSSHPAKDIENWGAVREAVLLTPMAELIREVEPGLID